MVQLSDLARGVLEDVRARAEAARVPISAEVLPRLEEVAALSAEASLRRLAGSPDAELEALLRARFQLLVAAASLELADVVKDSARYALTSAIHRAFQVAIGVVAP